MPNWCDNRTDIRGPQEDLKKLKAIIIQRKNRENPVVLTNLRPFPEELAEESNDIILDWQHANWGIKWGDCYSGIASQSAEHISIGYNTAWGPLGDDFWKYVSAQYPTLTFATFYEEEDMGFYGAVKFAQGTIIFDEHLQHPEFPDIDEDDDDFEAEEEAYYEKLEALQAELVSRMEAAEWEATEEATAAEESEPAEEAAAEKAARKTPTKKALTKTVPTKKAGTKKLAAAKLS